MGASVIAGQRPAGQSPIDLSGLNINPPVLPPVVGLNPGRDREAQLMRRVRQLEEELRVEKEENEKQVRQLFFPNLPSLRLLTLLQPESADSQIPRTLGKGERKLKT